MKHIKRELASSLMFALLLLVLDMISGSDLRYLTYCLVLLLGYAVYYLWRIFCIFDRVERYTLCRTVLDEPHGYSRRKSHTIYFTVDITDSGGNRLTVQTHRLHFNTAIHYINKSVTIAYNEETDMVVVIG